jgi:hypothetical protein
MLCIFILWFHIRTTGKLFFNFAYDTKEKEQTTWQSDLYTPTPPRTNQIVSCFDALFY